MRFTFAVVTAFIATSLAITFPRNRDIVDLKRDHEFHWDLDGDNPNDIMHLFLTNHQGNNDAYDNPRCVRIASGLHKRDQGYIVPANSIKHCVGGGEGWKIRAHKENHCFDTVKICSPGRDCGNIWAETLDGFEFNVQPYQPLQPN
ncbi:hypothetical protein PITC_010620 [Penicillium italicum]|uniref:Uncharacterized protein n=1 Tax=Penicillium italicum TaxID=40296 RepID=A0A0A2LCF0_PENIT|nr:hypothetical protein PITC_010620 [Penicillium italicum]